MFLLFLEQIFAKHLLDEGHRAFLLDAYLGLPEPLIRLDDVFSLKMQSLDTWCIPETAPDLESIKKARTNPSDCFFGPHVLELCQLADIVFLALHGDVGENGKIQAAFDLLGVKYTGSDSFSSALAMDKHIAKKLLKPAGIPVPVGTILGKNSILPLRDLGFTFPVVVKPCSGGSSIGVHIVINEDSYYTALENVFRYDDEVLIESYIRGREFSVGILDGIALPPIEIIPKSDFFDYNTKYQTGMTQEICPASLDEPISAEMQRLAVLAYETLGLSVYSRADFLLDKRQNIFCLEVNTLPGMTPTSLLPQEAAAADISYNALCDWIVQKSLERYK